MNQPLMLGIGRQLVTPPVGSNLYGYRPDVIAESAGKLLRGVKLFDIYRGTGIPEGKKSMAFSLELRADDRTLTDADSEGVMNKVLTALAEKLGAVLR